MMVGRVVQERLVVQVRAGAWSFAPVEVAVGRLSRLRGLRPYCGGRGMLFRTRSIQTFGMREPLLVVFLADDGVVLSARHVGPQSVVLERAARWVLELPAGTSPPAVGWRLHARRQP
jgi:uncharacterized membrane protein (UPF0127 family)